MPYNANAAADLGTPGAAPDPQSPATPPASGTGGAFHIPSHFLPDGMAAKIKAGDVLEFKATGPVDEEGDIPIAYNTGDGGAEGSGDGDSAEPWEKTFLKDMSPRGDAEGAM